MTTLQVFIKERVAVSDNGCWLWKRSILKSGYGCCRIDKVTKYAHRISFTAFVGPIQEGMHVLHECDVRACVNPAHLFLGTNRDNIADAVKKGRKKLPGERNGRHILTSADVLAIRQMPGSAAELAVLYGVSKSCIAHARNGRNWGHV